MIYNIHSKQTPPTHSPPKIYVLTTHENAYQYTSKNQRNLYIRYLRQAEKPNKSITNLYLSSFKQVKKTATSCAQSPLKKGIPYLSQFAKNFVRSYGQVETLPDENVVFNRVHSGCCEWFCRPEVALSEMAETFQTNLPLLTDNPSNLLNKESIEVFQSKLGPLVQALEPFNRRRHVNANPDIKQMLKCIWEEDPQLDNLMAEAYQIGSALFLTSLHYTVCKTLISSPERYAAKVKCASPEDIEFQTNPNVATLKTFLTQNTCKPCNESPSKSAAKRSLLHQLEELDDPAPRSRQVADHAEQANEDDESVCSRKHKSARKRPSMDNASDEDLQHRKKQKSKK